MPCLGFLWTKMKSRYLFADECRVMLWSDRTVFSWCHRYLEYCVNDSVTFLLEFLDSWCILFGRKSRVIFSPFFCSLIHICTNIPHYKLVININLPVRPVICKPYFNHCDGEHLISSSCVCSLRVQWTFNESPMEYQRNFSESSKKVELDKFLGSVLHIRTIRHQWWSR